MRIAFRSLVGAFMGAFLLGLQAMAGTGQIFSPAGLPQSSTQSYTPPTAGNTPTVPFSTPPLPVNGMSGFPASSLPIHAGEQKPSTTTPVEGGIQLNAPLAPQINSVETFFQCQPIVSPQVQNKPESHGPGRLLWHVLDNLGVPMLYGKDSDLDPSLNRTFIMPSPPVLQKSGAPVTPQKIPTSELEGTEPSPNDAK